MNKSKLIAVISDVQAGVVTVENRNNRPIILLDEDGGVVKEFKRHTDAMTYCLTNNICNRGWAEASLWHGRKMYHNDKGEPTQPKKDYTGIGYRISYKNQLEVEH